jgi:hypothetical protein
MLYKDGIPLTKTAPDFLCRVFARTAAGLRMLRLFAGSVIDPALIVSALRGVVCQDALEAALACVADKSPRICGLDLVLQRYQVVMQFSLGQMKARFHRP